MTDKIGSPSKRGNFAYEKYLQTNIIYFIYVHGNVNAQFESSTHTENVFCFDLTSTPATLLFIRSTLQMEPK